MRKKDPLKILLGTNIKKYRVQHGYTQYELAEMLSCDIKYLGDVENGWFYPSSELVLKISDALEVPVSVLFTVN